MKTRYILFAFAILAASACNKEAAQQDKSDDLIVITATQEGSRSTLQNGGTQVYWEPGDAIKVFYDKVGSKFESQCTSEVTISDFTGSLGFVGGGTESAAPEKYIWGLYPFRAGATSDGSSVTTSLSGSQTGKIGSFAPNTNITLARSENFGLAFYNVCGGVRFTLTKPGIKRVSIESLGGEALAGTLTATFQNGVPVVTSVSDPVTKITLKAPGSMFEPGQWYYIVALPGNLSGGFKMTFRSDEGSGSLVYNMPVEIKRGIFGSLADVDEGVEITAGGGGDDPEPIEIEIDGEFWDWAAVEGQSSGNHTVKVASDSQNIYVYARRASGGRYSELWGADSYMYFGFDLDNNSSTGESLYGSDPFEFVGFIRPYGGTAADPVIIEAAGATNCTSLPSPGSTVKNVVCMGVTDDSGYTIEFSIPRADIPAIPTTPIRVKFWGNKGLDSVTFTNCTL